LDLAGLRELGQASRDASWIEVQTFGDIASGAPGVLGEELNDAHLSVSLTNAGRRTAIARAPGSRAARGASRSGGGWAPVVGPELVDLLFKPSQMFLYFSTFSLEGVYDLLNTRQGRLLIER
jgi:hypothetical protein